MHTFCAVEECYMHAIDSLRCGRSMLAEAYHSGPGYRSARADELLEAVECFLEAARWRDRARETRRWRERVRAWEVRL